MQKRSAVILGAENNALEKFSVTRDAIHLALVISNKPTAVVQYVWTIIILRLLIIWKSTVEIVHSSHVFFEL